MSSGPHLRPFHPPIARTYTQTDLVSDIPGRAAHTDPNLVNSWGITSGATTPFWVADNGKGVATLYDGSGTSQPTPQQPLIVTIPPPRGSMQQSAPTGVVFNDSNRTTDFPVNGSPARFIFATEDGTIAAWALNSGTNAVLMVDNSGSGAVYKGLALANTADGSRLYATNFHNGTVDVFDKDFKPVTLASGAFTDSSIPRGFAPFGISNIGGNLFVTYAKQDRDRHDDVAGPGNGFVDVYDPNGNLLRRIAAGGPLNSPWGLAVAPAGFGRLSNDLLVGDFGDGHINAYRPVRGVYQFDGQLRDTSGKPIVIDGLWGLKFGTNVGSPNTLFFAAGINGEQHGLFGSLTPA